MKQLMTGLLVSALLLVGGVPWAMADQILLRQSDGTMTPWGGVGEKGSVTCDNCSGGGGGAGDASLAEQQTQTGILTTIDSDTGTIAGAVKAEDAAHSSGHTGIPFWGVRNDSASASFTDANGDYAPIATDSNGRLFINAISSIFSVTPGTTATALGKAEDAAHASGDTGVMSLCVRQDTAAALAGTNGDYIPCATDANGRLWTNADTELPAAASLADATSNPTVPGVGAFNMCWNGTNWDRCQKTTDPCQANTKAYANINGTAGATVITGTASKKIYVCSLVLVTATAQNINLVSGTGTVCGTGTTALLGLSGGTTAGTGWNFSANGGLTLGSGGFSLGQTQNNADNLCMLVSGSGQVTGGLSYVVQ